MKGLSLPINVLIIVIVAVIVLLGVMTLFMGSWTPFGQSMSAEAAKAAGCRKVINNCDAQSNEYDGEEYRFNGENGMPSFDVNGDGNTGTADDTMYDLCNNFYGTDCKSLCGCYTGSSSVSSETE